MFGPDDINCITTGKIADLFCRYWGENMQWENKSVEGPHEANFLKLDCSKIKRRFNWKPTWNIEKTIEKTIEFSKKYASGGEISKCMEEQINEFIEEYNKEK